MARGATGGLLQDVNGHGGKGSKHPQPVLDALLPSNVHEADAASIPALRRPHTVQAQRDGQSDSDSEEEGLHLHVQNGTRPKPALARAQSDLVSVNEKHGQRQDAGENNDARPRMRHGWEAQLENQEQAKLLSQNFFMYFEDKRHETAGNPPPDFKPEDIVSDWRMRDRLKTVSAVLAICLNVGVDPPDVIKTNPCARLECWVDPIPPDSTAQSSTNNSNAQIGKNLQSQYENLSLRTRYKVIPDPTIEDLKKYTT